ncbi:phosphatidate cytidylyltransferase [Fusobacterium sp.]|uniref:phosphatidate cytidylyltransferase n=1 Tax=Fusobacterium sp. TaxID=68766 RepID=UPI002900C356|nr:phosphatidate cytidylyltransferase [Fusobacterium sp.]MDU1910892.1 phosphatidate cytidylyltransferase [Fusobacterium sp.]
MNIFQKIPILIFFFFIAIGAYIFVYLLKNKFSKERYTNLCQRIKTWLMIIGIFYLGSINKISMIILFILISYLSLIEFLKLFDVKRTFGIKMICILIIGINYFIIYQNMIYIFYFFIPSIIIFINIFFKKEKIILSLFFSVYFISFISYLVNIESGILLILAWIILIELNDVYQYITGNIFGKRRIAPKISPNKTLEGVVGGIIMTTATIFFLNTAYGYKINIWMGPIIAILGFLGDISISYFKRKANKKDSGTILAGHGGILDRVDSLIFNSPVILLITLYLN